MSRIALVHDNFAQMGGAEKVAQAFHRLFPKADLHSTLAAQDRLPEDLRCAPIKTTWMQQLPSLHRYYRHYFMLYPLAIESLNLVDYDLILTNCFGYAKGVKKRPDAVHICYCHTPMRWIWKYEDYVARESFGGIKKTLLPVLLAGLKQWELRASRRPDYFVAKSKIVAQRIKDAYHREAVVIPPPIDVGSFKVSEDHQDYYLVNSRLVAYKRIDLAIEACNQLKRKLVIIGDGPDRRRLENLAGPTVLLLGRQPEEVVKKFMSHCCALLSTSDEEFGMIPLEVNAAGRPVIAYRSGGAMETVVEGETGLFFDLPGRYSLADTIRRFEHLSWNQSKIRCHAEKFDYQVFASRFMDFLSSVMPGVMREELKSAVVAARLFGGLSELSLRG